ncbi:NYN domain-containing protein [Aestuariicella sp. G3-2]|uniref:LabA-like NYN domain-containing protein n=1 Tax=Pseudomaricurvus albidus TaxID=2842452 RepID=UPI001C0D1403|nr:NYN domain-containing protein [Aestuariicella albida]MBU3070139.1 NYN domain-containing protein [Aestuariicella albida]
MSRERVLILVDVQNIYYTSRQVYGQNFNYNAFWAQVSQDYQIHKAIAYAIDRGDTQQRQFQNILRAIGFEVKLKPYIQRSDGSAKGDWDVGIAVDALDYAEQVNRVILVSGDGDFDVLVARLQAKFGVAVDVYGVESLTAASLIASATNFYPIDEPLLLAR